MGAGRSCVRIRVAATLAMGVVTLASALVVPATLAAQQAVASTVMRGAILGTVTDSGLVPLPDVNVEVIGASAKVSTDARGHFRIDNVPSGDFLFFVRKIGFRPVSHLVHVDAGDTLRLAFTVEPTLTELNTVTVTERNLSPRMQEFEARRKGGFGHFMTQGAIEKLNFFRLDGALRTFTELRLQPNPSSAGYLVVSSRFRCPMTVLVDRIPRGNNTDDLPSPKEVAAIEVYGGPASAPMMFGKVFCGLVLIWTRDGR